MKTQRIAILNKILIIVFVSFIPLYSVKGANHFKETRIENSSFHQCSIIEAKYINGQYMAVVNLSEVEVFAERIVNNGSKCLNDPIPLIVVFLPCIEIIADKTNDTTYLVSH